uniref:Kelch domain containing 1 n=1 Tax=Astyanax mexicanus TaxID=7994 RepID=A0A8B9L9A1_ASTMX
MATTCTFHKMHNLSSSNSLSSFNCYYALFIIPQSVADHEVFLPNDEIWLYDLESGLWERFDMGGEIPPSMSGMCGCVLKGHMYIFGGCGDDGQTNEHYLVDLNDGRYFWEKIRHHSGFLPSPRDKFSCWVYKSRIIYFGGYGHKLLSEINNPRTFIVDEASWAEDIFWGWNNEVHVFDSETKSWNCPTTSGRSWHTLTAVSETSLFLYGGLSMDCRPMSDGWMFDLKTKGWTEMKHLDMDKPRLWHTACLGRDSDVIVFGGSHEYIILVDSGHCNDILVFQTHPYSLVRLCEDFIASHTNIFQTQVTCLPLKLRQAVEKRTAFFQSVKKTQKVYRTME